MNLFNGRIRVVPLLCAAALIAIFLGIFGLAIHTGPGQVLDQALMELAPNTEASGFAAVFASTITPFLLMGGLLLALLVVLGERPLELAARVGFVTLGPITLSWWLKRNLERPHLDGLGMHNSFPSGTLTAVAAFACAVVLVAPRRWRLLVVVNAALMTIGTAVTVVALRWHRPSDAVGALLIVGAFTLIASAVTNTDQRNPAHAALADPRGERLIGAPTS